MSTTITTTTSTTTAISVRYSRFRGYYVYRRFEAVLLLVIVIVVSGMRPAATLGCAANKKKGKRGHQHFQKSQFILLASKKSSRRQKTYEIAILNFFERGILGG